MKKLVFALLALVAGVAIAAEKPRVAVFVQNRTSIKGMDDEVDGVRDRLLAELAATDAMKVVEPSVVMAGFKRWKVTVDEEKAADLEGALGSASARNLARLVGCDYFLLATIVNANVMRRNISGRLASVYNLRMTLRVMGADGSSVYAQPTSRLQCPILEATGDPMEYYQILFDQWAESSALALAEAAPSWQKVETSLEKLVTIHISTTIDETIAELESQTRGVDGELLAELRRVCGGATIEIDGLAIGSAPGDFQITPGFHQLRIRREWMKPYTATIHATEGFTLKAPLELSEEGVSKWSTLEAVRADLAQRYAAAAMQRKIKVDINTKEWRDVGVPHRDRLILE